LIKYDLFELIDSDCIQICFSLFYDIQVEEGMCAYYANKSKNTSNRLYKIFGVNAAGNGTFLPGTVVEVMYNSSKVLITINNQTINRTDITLDLYNEAAQDLGINKEGLVPCKLKVPFIENHVFMKDIYYYFPFFSVIIGSFVVNLLYFQ